MILISYKGSVNISEDEKVIEEDINPFHAAGLFLHPSKTSESQRFSDVFRGYRNRPLAWNELILLNQWNSASHALDMASVTN